MIFSPRFFTGDPNPLPGGTRVRNWAQQYPSARWRGTARVIQSRGKEYQVTTDDGRTEWWPHHMTLPTTPPPT